MRRKDSRLIEAMRLARQHDPDPPHAFQVARIAADLFAGLSGLHGLGAPEERLLVSASLLHDTGHALRPDAHHKGARDLIMQANLPGFTDRERSMIACVARYHRAKHPQSSHAVYSALEQHDRGIVQKLSAILRIADGLDRAHAASVKAVAVAQRERVCRIEIVQRFSSIEDIEGARRKSGLFEEVFGLRVELIESTSQTNQDEVKVDES